MRGKRYEKNKIFNKSKQMYRQVVDIKKNEPNILVKLIFRFIYFIYDKFGNLGC